MVRLAANGYSDMFLWIVRNAYLTMISLIFLRRREGDTIGRLVESDCLQLFSDLEASGNNHSPPAAVRIKLDGTIGGKQNLTVFKCCLIWRPQEIAIVHQRP